MALAPELDRCLKATSRSIYLSLRILPSEIRETMSLGYLFCRAADTLADTPLLPSQERLNCLEGFAKIFKDSLSFPGPMAEILKQALPLQDHLSEKRLLEALPLAFQSMDQKTAQERNLLREVVLGVIEGMRMDLHQFASQKSVQAAGKPGAISSLKDAQSLEQYCHWIGGAPGAFWTKLCILKVKEMRQTDGEALVQNSIRLGKGLQLTNILRDIASDLRIGRCYIPAQELAHADLRPEDLLEPHASTLARFNPLLGRWALRALEHLSFGKDYVLSLPVKRLRLRAAAAWPLWIALKTVRRISESPHLLDLKTKVKISRRDLYGTLLFSPLLYSDAAFRNIYQRLHRQASAAIPVPESRS